MISFLFLVGAIYAAGCALIITYYMFKVLLG